LSELAALLHATGRASEADRLYAELKAVPVWCVEEVLAAE
jgi:hypothetical protein